MKKWLTSMLVAAAVSLHATEFYVAPSLVCKGDGSTTNPWDLQTALNHPSSVKPGDIIWVRGGVHRRSFVNAAGKTVVMPTRFNSKLLGSPSAPITVRAFPGEQPTIDGNLQQKSGGHVTFWGLEIMCSLPKRYTTQAGCWPRDWWVKQDGKQAEFCVSGVDVGGNPDEGAAWVPGMKFINCIVHDNVGGGFGLGRSSAGILVYGCLVYYNGWRGYHAYTWAAQNHGHGFYIQHAGTARTVIKNCFSYQNYGQGSQYYGTDPGYTDYGTYDGLVTWQNSHFQSVQQRNMEYGNGTGSPSLKPTVVNCMVYDTRGSVSDSEFGAGSGLRDCLFTNNYFGSPVDFHGPLHNSIVRGNSFMAGVRGSVNASSFPNNTFRHAQPTTEIKTAVYPNEYEKGRGNIVIFNWSKASTVSVDVSAVGLEVGDAYELHQADDYFNDISYGTYKGAEIIIPMTGHTVATPIGANDHGNPDAVVKKQPSTFPTFGAFVIMKRGGSTAVNPGTNPGTITNTPPPPATRDPETVEVQPTASLVLRTNGAGSITGTCNTTNLVVGRTYTATAVPASRDWVFTTWSGSANSGTPALKFVMQTNTVLEATFVPNPYPTAKGSYTGLFFDTSNIEIQSSGYFTLNLTANGSFSGRVMTEGSTYSFSSRFSGNGAATVIVPRKKKSSLLLTLKTSFGSQQITGTINEGTWNVPVVANRNAFSQTNQATAFDGKYTMILPGSNDAATRPGGNGYGTVSVDLRGNVRMPGRLADGTAISQQTTISKDGYWPLYVSLYGGKGLLLAWASFAGTSGSAPTGNFIWMATTNKNAKLYKNGFTNYTAIVGSTYSQTAGRPLLNFTNAIGCLSGGNLSSPITFDVLWGPKNIVEQDTVETNRVLLSVNSTYGALSGKLFNPEARQSLPFRGVVLQNRNAATGYFLGTNQSGLFLLQRKY